MPSSVTSRPIALLASPLVLLLFLVIGTQQAAAQNITTVLEVFDNIGNSTDLRIGINSNASDGIDPALGEVELTPVIPGNFDARLIDNDFRSPSILGNGVLKDLRGIFTAPPISQTFEVRVRREPGASNMWIRWSLPLGTGISTMRLVSYPNPAVLDVDMSTTAQVELPAGTNRYFIEATYGDPPPTRYTLNVEVDPPNKGAVFRLPMQQDYAPGQPVTLLAFNLTAPDTCYTFSHWEGDASGTSSILTVMMTKSKNIVAKYAPRKFPVTVSSLDTFVVTQNPPDPQKIHITNSGLMCFDWTATPTVPWLRISKTVGTGNDSIDVEVITSAIPCPGTHVGTIALQSDFMDPETMHIPVIIRIGRTELTAKVEGSPTILSCQKKATELIKVTIANDGINAVTFTNAPDLGDGFVLKNPAIFPLTVPSRDSVAMYVEFAPLPAQRGTIIENVIMAADACGQEVIFKLEASRIAPTVTADVFELDFGLVNSCGSDPLPQRDIVLENAYSQTAVLRYTLPSGFTLIAGPDSLPGGTTATVTVEPARLGPADINEVFTIEADFGICYETFSIDMFGLRQDPSFFAEAVDTPGQLPPQLYDTTCVGEYSEAKSIRIVNNGDAELMMTISVNPPFEIDAFSNTFPLAAGKDRIVPIRFHPTASGTFEETLTISADPCGITSAVDLRGSTFSQQILVSSVTPAHVILANCEPSVKVMLQVMNTGTEPVRFTDLPALPDGFAWDETLQLPIVIPPDSASPFEGYITFAPPLGEGGNFGGSVQWFGEPCGSTVYFTLSGERILPQVTVTPEIADFGEMISCGSSTTGPVRMITVENNSPLPITLNAIAPASKYDLLLGASQFPTQGVEIRANDSEEIGVMALPGGGGAFNDTLMLEIIAGTGGFCRESIPVVLRGERYQPRFLVRENGYSTNFGDICVNATAVRGFILENTGDKPITISSEGFTSLSPFQLLAKPFKITLDPGTYQEFPVRYSPLQVGMDAATIFFMSDLCPDTVSFTVRGRGVAPSMDVTSIMPAGPLQILSCESGKSRQIRATLENTGGTPITIVDGSLMPEGFTYDPPQQFPFTLQAGQTRDVLVRFTAEDAGNYSGVVTLYGEPCDVQAAFPVQAEIISSTYTLIPQELNFGEITVCPDGHVRPADADKLRRVLTFSNTGDVPVDISAVINPGDSPLAIVAPLSWPMTIPAGQTQTITVALGPPFDEIGREFSGVVEVTVTRDQACVPERNVIPFGGILNRVTYAFAEGTVSTTETCISEPVELKAELINASSIPIEMQLRLDGSAAFAIDGPTTITIPAHDSKMIPVIYTPTAELPNTVLLIAAEDLCFTQATAILTVEYDRPNVAMSCDPEGTSGPQITARPGDIIEIPVYLIDELTCPIPEGALTFELQFEGRALAPDRIISSQGAAEYARTSADVILVTIDADALTSGEIARLAMEVLVGPNASTEFTLMNATLQPDVALVSTDAGCTGTVTVRPRNGVTTLEDLGITSLNPPQPNVLDGNSRQTQLSYSVKADAYVELKLYDMLGVEVGTIHEGMVKRGVHSIRYPAQNLRPGVYFVVMTSGNFRSAQKLIVAN